MPITRPRLPSGTREAFERGMRELAEINRVPPGLVLGHDPQQVYILQNAELANGATLAGAKPVYWQFLMGTASGPAAAAAVKITDAGEMPRLASLSRGPYIQKAIETAAHIDAIARHSREIPDKNYELRRLAMPGLSIHAFWLKSMEDDADLAIPYHRLPRGLTSMQVYPMDEFLSIVQALAQKRAQFDDSKSPNRK